MSEAPATIERSEQPIASDNKWDILAKMADQPIPSEISTSELTTSPESASSSSETPDDSPETSESREAQREKNRELGSKILFLVRKESAGPEHRVDAATAIDLKYDYMGALRHVAEDEEAFNKLDSATILANFDGLLDRGMKVETLASRLSPYQVAENIDMLSDHGVNIDINNLTDVLTPGELSVQADKLLDHGANVDAVTEKLSPISIVENLDTLSAHDAKIDLEEIVGKLQPDQIADNLTTLNRYGADVDVSELISKLDADEIYFALDTLLENGVDANALASRLTPDQIKTERDTLIAHGANLEANVDSLDQTTRPSEPQITPSGSNTSHYPKAA